MGIDIFESPLVLPQELRMTKTTDSQFQRLRGRIQLYAAYMNDKLSSSKPASSRPLPAALLLLGILADLSQRLTARTLMRAETIERGVSTVLAGRGCPIYTALVRGSAKNIVVVRGTGHGDGTTTVDGLF